MFTIPQADQITQEWVEENVDLERARQVCLDRPMRSESQKLTLLDYKPEYEWMIDDTLGDVEVLTEVAVSDVEPGEKDWDRALMYETTRQYIEWFQEGHEPPPITVVRHVDGSLISANRRRWLAARAAGVKTLKCWYSPTSETGRPKWELRLCSMGGDDRICREYSAGGSCVTCAHFEER